MSLRAFAFAREKSSSGRKSVKLQSRTYVSELSALCEHAMDFNHTIDWEKSEILKVENNYSKRLISEAWFINANPKVMNRSDGDSLPNVYCSLAK